MRKFLRTTIEQSKYEEKLSKKEQKGKKKLSQSRNKWFVIMKTCLAAKQQKWQIHLYTRKYIYAHIYTK